MTTSPDSRLEELVERRLLAEAEARGVHPDLLRGPASLGAERPSPAGHAARHGSPAGAPVAMAAGTWVPSWLFDVQPPGCRARWLQDVVASPVVGADYEFTLAPADPGCREPCLCEVVSDGSAVSMTARGRGVRVLGSKRLTRGAASHLNRRARRAMGLTTAKRRGGGRGGAGEA